MFKKNKNMAKGDYRREYGGSKSGYYKGVKDTLITIGTLLLSTTVIIASFMVKKK